MEKSKNTSQVKSKQNKDKKLTMKDFWDVDSAAISFSYEMKNLKKSKK